MSREAGMLRAAGLTKLLSLPLSATHKLRAELKSGAGCDRTSAEKGGAHYALGANGKAKCGQWQSRLAHAQAHPLCATATRAGAGDRA